MFFTYIQDANNKLSVELCRPLITVVISSPQYDWVLAFVISPKLLMH